MSQARALYDRFGKLYEQLSAKKRVRRAGDLRQGTRITPIYEARPYEGALLYRYEPPSGSGPVYYVVRPPSYQYEVRIYPDSIKGGGTKVLVVLDRYLKANAA